MALNLNTSHSRWKMSLNILMYFLPIPPMFSYTHTSLEPTCTSVRFYLFLVLTPYLCFSSPSLYSYLHYPLFWPVFSLNPLWNESVCTFLHVVNRTDTRKWMKTLFLKVLIVILADRSPPKCQRSLFLAFKTPFRVFVLLRECLVVVAFVFIV